MSGNVQSGTGMVVQINLKMNVVFAIIGVLSVLDGSVLGAPVSYAANQSSSAMQIVFIPARYIYGVIPPAPYYPHHQQTRGPLQFIGNWIDSSDWFPIEVNVPDVFSNIGSGVGNVAQTVGQLAQNMGAGIMTFTQNVGSGIQNFAQGIGQRVPFIAALVRPSTTPNEGQEVAPQMYMILVPERGYAGDPPLSQMESEILETFP
ncbi:unnamed protein product [Acanthoscelides obtectus]|uniref:Uncharacterized protein n=1 Tax=Acanthoscelides obtectus TaxID=200917 RepID=A0A9P0PFC5_ACAOB|nr:unnamed protein product [Acanthoscelides obtectus]CAK1631217.1 hypothetical protein AOBTE_LOCUS6820 [Acanthoscelides obtectus]